MAKYHRYYGRGKRFPRRVLILIIILVALLVGGSVVVHNHYSHNLRPVGGSHATKYITIHSGSSVGDIAMQLENAGLIRSSQAFEWYVSSHNQRDKLQAGTYAFNADMSTGQIANAIAAGKVATDLVTILPGQRLDQIREAFIKAGFKATAVDAALQAKNYQASYPALADNPPGSSLEGFLYPDSYQKTSDTDPSQIVGESLEEMQKHLTTDVRNGFAKQGLSVYQGVTLASMVEMEVSKTDDRAKVAQVFLTRLHQGMRLGSDVTVRYSKLVGDPAYDTTVVKGLPAGPISTVSDVSLKAAAHPANTDWLYFVSGDNGITYFSHTFEEHQANVAKYCHKLCSKNS